MYLYGENHGSPDGAAKLSKLFQNVTCNIIKNRKVSGLRTSDDLF